MIIAASIFFTVVSYLIAVVSGMLFQEGFKTEAHSLFFIGVASLALGWGLAIS